MDSPPIRISDWTPINKSTVRGAFTITLPSGMIIHRMTFHEKPDPNLDGVTTRWISLPAHQWTGQNGQKQYAPIIEFTTKEIRDRFQLQVLKALEQFLSREPNGAQQQRPVQQPGARG